MQRKNVVNFNVLAALLLLPNVVVSRYDNYYGNGYPYEYSVTSVYLPLITGKCKDMDPTISLNLSGMQFGTIPANFIESEHVNCLTLRSNNIRTISNQAFQNVPNLFFLDLSDNSLSGGTTLYLSLIENLKTLVLDNILINNYENIPELTTMQNLEHLYIRNNYLRSINTVFRYITPRLTHLYLSDNQLESTTLFQNLPETLTHLYLENNWIRNILEPLPENLTELNLNGNRIESICHRYCSGASLLLRGAEKLEKLSLSGNRIAEIATNAFDDAENLLSLDLSRNKIEIIDEGTFLTLIKLENLSISDNALTSVPNFYSLSNIKFLNFNNNSIALIDSDALCNISSLNTLLLANNRIQSVDDKFFACLASVEVLDLSNNQLRSLSAPQKLPPMALRKLYVRNNLFEAFDDLSLPNVKNLTDVYIQNNLITHLNTALMLFLPHNVTVHFWTNCTDPI